MNQVNPQTPVRTPEENHRRQAAWQIWLPLGFILLIFLTAGVLTVLFTLGYSPQPGLPDQQSPLAKGSVILLVGGSCLGGLLQLLVLLGLVLLCAKMISGLPGLAHRIQAALALTSATAKKFGDTLASPFIKLSSLKAAWGQLLKSAKFWKRGSPQE